MSSKILYVAITRRGRGGGPCVGDVREDIGVEVLDSSTSFQFAIEQATKEWSKKRGLRTEDAYIFGVY